MSDRQETYIYESPDGGETVYRRPTGGDPQDRQLVSETPRAVWNRNRSVWNDILAAAPNDPALMEMLRQVQTYYTLKTLP